VGIIAIAALVGVALVSCDIEDLLAGLIPEEAYGQVTVTNSTNTSVTVSLAGSYYDSSYVEAGGSKTFYDVPANESITVLVSTGTNQYTSDPFTLSKDQKKNLTFNGSTVR